jgi:predicted ATP-grasp superfamily ATP-dependent carboligase
MNVLIFSTNEDFAVHILRCLSVMEIRICVMGISKFHPIRLSRYCNNYYKYDLHGILGEKENGSIVNKINSYCKQQKIDVIIPAGIEGTLFISKISEKITESKVFPLSKLDVLELLNNKWSFGELLSKNGIPSPKTILINDISRLKSLDSELKSLNMEFPVMAKQLELEASRGVVKLNSSKELDVYMSSENEFNKLPLLIQEYIPGMDMGFNVLAKNGKIIAWSIQKWYPGNNGMEFIRDDNILDIGRRIVSCCNFTGVANIDMRLDNRDKSVKVTECNPRFWGSVDISMLGGVNFPCLGVLMTQENIEDMITTYGDISCREIRYSKPKTLMSEILRNMSIKGIDSSSLYFLQQIISDPISYGCINMMLLASRIKGLFANTQK